MPTTIQISRGDKKLKELEEGELFYSYININPIKSNGHSFSLGQLFIKDPSKKEPIELASLRNLDSLRIAGHIDNSFNGDFINAPEESLPQYRRCHAGDIFIIDEDIDEGKYLDTFYKSDLLIITEAIYEPTTEGPFRDTLQSVSYIRYPGTDYSQEGTDLEAKTMQEAIKELALRLKYVGEISKEDDVYLPSNKKKGNLFYITKPFTVSSDNFIANGRIKDSIVYLRMGDFIYWNGKNWILIPSGKVPADIEYVIDLDVINKYDTFEEYHKKQLMDCKTLKDVIDFLVSDKAPLNKFGKIPYSVLPDTVRNGLSLRGKFNPIRDINRNPNYPENQNDWPYPFDPNDESITTWNNGWFYIVDCEHKVNVQYQDKLNEGRIIELNSGDFIVWCESTGRFEIIDNSDRISSITFIDENGVEHSLIKDIKIQGDDLLKITVNDNVATLTVANPIKDAKENYHVKFNDKGELVYSLVYERDGIVHSKGNIRVEYTKGDSVSGEINNGYEILSEFENEGTIKERLTKVKASEVGDKEEVIISLPEETSTVIARMDEDVLLKDYITKVFANGFITDSLIRETLYETLRNEFVGEVNIGAGRTKSEDLYTGEVSFFGKTEDPMGFYVNTNPRELEMNRPFLREHELDESSSRTTVRINPKNLRGKKDTNLVLPEDNGVLTTFEEQFDIYSHNGEALIVPVWELFTDHDRKTLGLSKSPISIKINRIKSGEEDVDRNSDLTEIDEYNNSDSSLLGPTKENIVSFDSWIAAKRVVSSKQGFVLPSANESDSNNISEKGFADKSHLMTAILPSETKFKGNPEYTDVFGNHVPQNVKKVIEVPAESGVLVTHESIIRRPYYS